MKAICAGTTTRNDVVHQSLEQYREVFVRTTRQINVLKEVSFTRTMRSMVSIADSTATQSFRKYILPQDQQG